MVTVIEHLSYSSISLYLSCPRAWKFRYIEKPDTPKSVNLVFGSAFHNALEDYLFEKVTTGKTPKILDHWHNAWDKIIETEGDQVLWGVETPKKYRDLGASMLTDVSVKEGIDKITPKMGESSEPIIEKFVKLQVPGVPIPVIGYIDVITADNVPCDFKTSSRKWGDSKAAEELQPLFYLAAMNQLRMASDGTFRHYIFVKTKTPQFQVIEHKHGLGEIVFLFQLIKNVWDGIQSGTHYENPTTWLCSDKWCDYWHLCRGKFA